MSDAANGRGASDALRQQTGRALRQRLCLPLLLLFGLLLVLPLLLLRRLRREETLPRLRFCFGRLRRNGRFACRIAIALGLQLGVTFGPPAPVPVPIGDVSGERMLADAHAVFKGVVLASEVERVRVHR